MGKWATYSRRGAPRQFASQEAPSSASWTLTAGATPNVQTTIVGFPAGIASFRYRFKPTASPTWTVEAYISGSSTNATTGIMPATSYSVQIAWAKGGSQISDWSAVKTVVTP